MRLNLFVKKHAINMSAVAGIDQLVPGRVISCKTMHDEQFTGSVIHDKLISFKTKQKHIQKYSYFLVFERLLDRRC